MKYTISDIDVFVMTRNRAKLLAETIESLLAQTVRPDVITVFDNDSSDNTCDVVRRFKNVGVRYVRTTGLIGNFLAMQKWSQRPYVVHFHDDNLIHPDYMEKALLALNTIDNVAGVTGAYSYFACSSNGRRLISTGYRLLDDFLILSDKQAFVIHKVRAEAPPHDVIVDNIGALIYRADYFRKRVSMTWKYGKGDDLEVCMSLLDYGKLVTISDRNSVFIRNHARRDVNIDGNSMTLEQAFNWVELYIDAARTINSPNFWRQFIGMIYTQYPYFVKRTVYEAVSPGAFLGEILFRFRLTGNAEQICRDFLSHKLSVPHLVDERETVRRHRSADVRFWWLRQVGKLFLPYELVVRLRKFMIKHHI